MSGPIDLTEGKEPGQWQRFLLFDGDLDQSKRRWTAIIYCPGECRKVLMLVDHKIDDNGQVSPSVGHPSSYPPCSWHVTPRLVGWGPVPPIPPPRAVITCERCREVKTVTLGGWGTWSGGTGVVCPKCFKAPATHELPPAKGAADV